MREHVADECRDDADRCLPPDAVGRAIHLEEQSDGYCRADNAAHRGKLRVLEREGGKDVAARHHEKAGKPGPCKLLSGRAGKPVPPESGCPGDVERKARHWLILWLAVLD